MFVLSKRTWKIETLTWSQKMKRYLLAIAAAASLILGLPALAKADDCTNLYPGAVVNGNVVIQVAGNCTLAAIHAVGGGISIISTGGSVTLGAMQGDLGVTIRAETAANVASAISSGGSISIFTYSGDTIITGQVTTTTGSISITGNNITTGNLKSTTSAGTRVAGNAIIVDPNNTLTVNGSIMSGDYVDLYVPTTSTADTVKVTGAISAGQAAVWLLAGGNISTGAITSYGGQISFHANVAASSTTATTVLSTSASSANGVGGAINANAPTTLAVAGGGIYLTNGGTGGIAIAKATDLSAKAINSQPGYIIVDACNENDTDPTCSAPITIGAGTLSSDGTSTYPAGGQAYIASAITFTGTTLSASDTAPAASHPEHYVVIAAKTVTLSGSGLIINATGPQPTSPGFNAAAQINNQNANSFSDQFNGIGSGIAVTTTALPVSPLTINGPGALTINGNGANAHVGVQGSPLTFGSTLGAVKLSANDSAGVLELLTGTGTALAFNETTAVVLNSNGPSTGGNAVTVNIFAGSLTQPVKPNITINSTGVTTGNGGNITLFTGSGNLTLGTKAGEFLLVANGGATGGNGGTIDVNPNPGTVTIDTANAVTAKVPGTNGKGGIVTINSGGFSVTPTLAAPGATINVNGNGTGDGGEIHILGGSTVTLGTEGVGSLSLSAQSNGTGNGGTIEVGYISTLTLGGTLSVNAGTAGGNGNGGTINIHDNGGITLASDAQILANGYEAGYGGQITLDSNGTNLSASTILVSALGGATGDGGIANISSPTTQFNIDADVNIDAGDIPGGCCIAAAVPAAGFKPLDSVNRNIVTVKNKQSGKITTCTQLKTGYGNWPKKYWDCVNPANPTSGINVAATSLQSPLQTELRNALVQIFYMSDITDFDNYFTSTPPASLTGIYGISAPAIKVSAAFANTLTSGGAPQASPYAPGSIVHEIGHQLDVIWGNPSTLNGAGTWGAAITSDNTCNANTCINGVPCTTVFLAATCNNPNYAGFTNFQILNAVYNATAQELFAKVFEHNETNSVQPELENALSYLPSENAYMKAVIAKAVPDGKP
jgi:hypothetical protein